MKSENKTCQNCKSEFTIEPEDFLFYEKIKVPPPTFCPECRFARRLVHWNEHNLFRKKDARTNQEIFSTYPGPSLIKIYDHDYWWSDEFDGMQYGRDYDFSRSFFEQFKELMLAVPWPSRAIQGLINSDYCNQASYNKNCYLCFNGGYSENCLYGVAFIKMKDSIDFYQSSESELCYDILSVGSAYQNFFTSEGSGCRNVWFCLNCENCSDCFGCVNLRHKQYHIFNKPYSEKEYREKIRKFDVGSHRALMMLKRQVFDFRLKFPRKYLNGAHNVNVSGDYIYYSKNAKFCYQTLESEDVKYLQNIGVGAKDSYDYTNWGENAELIYEAISCGENCRNIRFSFDCWPACQDVEYSMNCHSSSNLFGCVGLKKKNYCILNKQYSPKEYFYLRGKIINHMSEIFYTDRQSNIYRYGEFFPPEFSPLAYNESAAVDYYPFSKNEAVAKNLEWRDPNKREFEITLGAGELPDRIDLVNESILKELIACVSCGRAYRILTQELEFYRKFRIALPRQCPECRFRERRKLINPYKLYNRKCQCAGDHSTNNVYTNQTTHFHNQQPCPNEFETSYAPERKEIVYCEQCYQSEVI